MLVVDLPSPKKFCKDFPVATERAVFHDHIGKDPPHLRGAENEVVRCAAAENLDARSIGKVHSEFASPFLKAIAHAVFPDGVPGGERHRRGCNGIGWLRN